MTACASEPTLKVPSYGTHRDSVLTGRAPVAALAPAEPAAEHDVILDVPEGYRLASGDILTDARLHLRLAGNLEGPAVVALGGISAGRCVAGENGWWRCIVDEQGAIALDEVCVIGLDFSPVADARVAITPHDQAELLRFALDELGIAKVKAIVGASYGGMVAMAFGAIAPTRVERLCVIAAAHRPSAQGRAWRGVQRRIFEFGLEQGEPLQGLALARQLAMITYRTPEEFEQRFGGERDDADGAGVDRYLTNRGGAYTKVMAPLRWLSLSESIDRFSIDPALIQVPTTVIAFSTDCLVPVQDMRELKARLPRVASYHEIPSLYGHDAFLKEPAALRPILHAFLKDEQ